MTKLWDKYKGSEEDPLYHLESVEKKVGHCQAEWAMKECG